MYFMLSFLVLFAAQSALAISVYVSPVQGNNLPPDQLDSVREFIRVQIENSEQHDVVDQETDADFVIKSQLVKLENYQLSMSRWQGKEKLMQGQWTAATLGALEGVIKNATPEVLHTSLKGQKAVLFDNSKSLGEQAEEKKQRSQFERIQATRQVSLGLGPSYFSRMNSEHQAITFLLGYTWGIDEHFDLGVKSQFAMSTMYPEAYVLGGQIHTNYFFATKDISPFIGTGFGYSYSSAYNPNNRYQDERAAGFTLSGAAGVKFFRTSSVSFSVGAEITTIFDKNSLGQPSIFSLIVQLHF